MKGKKTHPSGRAWWREYRMTCLVLAAAVAVFIAARLIAVRRRRATASPEEYAEYENGVITQILADNTVTDPHLGRRGARRAAPARRCEDRPVRGARRCRSITTSARSTAAR